MLPAAPPARLLAFNAVPAVRFNAETQDGAALSLYWSNCPSLPLVMNDVSLAAL